MGHANMTPTRPPRGTEEPHSRSAADGVSAYSWMSRRSSHSGGGVRATRSCHRGVACRRAALRSSANSNNDSKSMRRRDMS